LKALCLIAVAIGIGLRLWGLDTHPSGLDIDEASILYWAGVSFKGFSFPIYSPQATHWEMLPGYLYYPAYLFTGVLRLFPALIGIAEVVLLGVWVSRESDREKGLLAAALLALCPWHIFYSRIVGTCTGVIFFFLLTRLFTSKLARVGGLLYYTTYRLVWLRECIESVMKRDWRRLGAALISLVAVFGIILCSPSSLASFFRRGTYNFTTPQFSFLENYFQSLLLPFFPLSAAFRQTSDRFIADYVHTALADSLPGPVLGWALALVCAVGIFKGARRFPKEVIFLVGTWLALGFMGPSLSRFLIALPVLILLAAYTLGSAKYRVPFAAVTLMLTLIPSVLLLKNLGDSDRLENLFHSRHLERDRWIDQNLPTATPHSVHVVVEDGYLAARFWAWRSAKYSVYPVIPEEDLAQILRESPGASQRTLLWDLSVPRRFAPADPASLSELDALQRRVDEKARIFGLEHHAWGDLYVLEWPTSLARFDRD